MADRARKPYLGLKQSLVEFFRAPVVFMKQINEKFSETEKPYLEDEYQSMHLRWPRWQWGSWRWRFPPWGPLEPKPRRRGPRSQFFDPEDPAVSPVLQEGCLFISVPPTVTPGETYVLVLSVGATPVIKVEVDGPATVTSSDCMGKTWPPLGGRYYAGGYCELIATIDSGAVDEDLVTISVSTADGRHCGASLLVVEECDTGATIAYTSLQMQTDEVQTLEAYVGGSLAENEAYTWAISSGEGSLSGGGEGNSVNYTAPSTNAECDGNATITLSCGGDVIDTITLSINLDGYNPAGVEVGVVNCYEDGATWRCQIYYYNCDGTAGSPPIVTLSQCTGSPPGCTCAIACSGYSPPNHIVDLRTSQEKTDGCCPEQLLW